MVMSMAIASIHCDNAITIDDADAIKKSYPSFWDDFVKLGGQIDE